MRLLCSEKLCRTKQYLWKKKNTLEVNIAKKNTVLLACNMDGTEKVALLEIGKYAKPCLQVLKHYQLAMNQLKKHR